jgi:hypothetical protein
VIAAVELVEQVRVGRQRHRRRVPGLAGDLDHRRALGDQQADEAVAQIVGSRMGGVGMLGGFGEGALSPVAGAVGVSRLAVGRGEDQIKIPAVVGLDVPVEQIRLERREQAHRAGTRSLRRLDLPERDRPLD